MAGKGKGKMIRKDFIEEEVLRIGSDIAKSLDPAINKYDEFNKSINEVKKNILSLAKLSKEFKGVSTSKGFTEKVIKQNQVLDKSRVAYQNVIKQQNDLIKTEVRLQHATSSTAQALIKERVQLQATNKLIKQAKLEELGLVGAYQKLNRERTEAKTILANLLSAEKINTKEVDRARKAYERLNVRVLKIDKATDNYTKNIGNYKSALGGAISTTRQFASALGLMGGAFAVVSVFRNAFNSIKSFDDSMQNLSGIARVTREDMADLERTIIDVAGDSVRTATEVAKLAESLTTLGKTKEEVKALLQPVNDLSLALGSASDETGEFLVQMLNTFGGGTDEALKYADTIATIRTSTSLNFQKMRDSFQYLAPISKLLNKDLAYTGALVGILADNGIKAERAGRLLGSSQLKLASEGLTLNDALEEVNKAIADGKTELEVAAVATKLFGKNSTALGVILASNSEAIDKNADAIRNNSGALKDLVDQQLLSLSAHLDILNSKWESYILNTDKASGSSNSLKKAIKFLSDNLEKIISTSITLVKIWITYKVVVKLASFQTSLMSKKIVAQTLVSRANAVGISTMSVAWKKFNAVLKANVLGITIALLYGLYTILQKVNVSNIDVAKSMNKSNEEFIKQATVTQNANEKIKTMSTRYDELTEKAKSNKDETKKNVKEQTELDSIIRSLGKQVPKAVQEFDEYGKTIGINTEKLREFLKETETQTLQLAETKIKNQTDLLKKLEAEQTKVNDALKNGNAFKTAEGDLIRQTNKGLVNYIKRTSTISKTGKQRLEDAKDGIELSEKQQVAFQKERLERKRAIDQTKESIEVNKDLIGTIQGVLTERQKEIIETKRIADENKKIADEKAKRKKLTDEQKEDARKYALLLKTDAFNLAKFLLDTEIKLQWELLKNESESFTERGIALEQKSLKEIELAKLTRDRLLDNEELTADEKELINKKYLEKIRLLQNGFFDGQDALEKERIAKIKKDLEDRFKLQKKSIDKEKKIKESALKDAIILENKAFDKIQNKTLKDVEAHEKKISDIKKRFAKETLDAQIKAVEKILNTEKLTTEQRGILSELLKDLKIASSNASTKIINENLEDQKKKEETIAKFKEEFISKASDNLADILNLDSENLNKFITGIVNGFGEGLEGVLNGIKATVDVIRDISNAVYQERIENIDFEIEKSNEYYDHQLELAGDDAEKKKLIELEKAKATEKLEKKKRKEQTKQAKLNKALAIVDVGIATALGIMQAYAQLGPIGGSIAAALVGVLGAIQTAAIIATPIPKYAKGTSNHIGGWAEVGEVRPEVVIEPNKAPYIVNDRSFLDLPKGTQVVPSLAEYDRLFNPSLMDSIQLNQLNVDSYNSRKREVENRQMIELMKENNALLKRKKPLHIRNVNNNKGIAEALDFINYKRNEGF